MNEDKVETLKIIYRQSFLRNIQVIDKDIFVLASVDLSINILLVFNNFFTSLKRK